MLRVRLSEFAAVPRTTARIRSPSRSASDNRFNSTTAQPSERTKPSAASSNGLHRPTGESIPGRTPRRSCGLTHHLAAAGEREVALPDARLRAAMWTASSPDEQAVSAVNAGPFTSST